MEDLTKRGNKMVNSKKIAVIGGGSVNWMPRLLKDILLKECIETIDFQLLDIDIEQAEFVAEFGRHLSQELGLKHKFTPTLDSESALDGADFILITISTGGLETMRYDLEIPEKYKIFATVGDTVGPGGWSRNIRNIPVFQKIGEDVKRLCPEAVILNYTNPMAALTDILIRTSNARVIGLCHGLFENLEAFKDIFNLESESELSYRSGGVNHFFWMWDLKIKGKDGKKLLYEKLEGTNLEKLINGATTDPLGFRSAKFLCEELMRFYDLVPYLGDRHTSEFFPSILTGDFSELERLGLHRTTISEREDVRIKSKNSALNHIDGSEKWDMTPSRETCSDIIEAISTQKEFIDVINVPNCGQINNLPVGAVVETLGVINSTGFLPISVGNMPEEAAELCRPHAINQINLCEGYSNENKQQVLSALYNDPCLNHLNLADKKALAEELILANSEYLPAFLK